jgi:hypothetical protein
MMIFQTGNPDRTTCLPIASPGIQKTQHRPLARVFNWRISRVRSRTETTPKEVFNLIIPNPDVEFAVSAKVPSPLPDTGNAAPGQEKTG